MNKLDNHINQNYDEYHKVVKKITNYNELADDLYHHCLMIVYNYDTDKIENIITKGYFKFFFIRIVVNNWHSTTSPFYTTYRSSTYLPENYDITDNREDYDYEGDEEFEKKIKFINDTLNDEKWYVQKVVELKTNNSYGAITKITNIPRSSLYTTFNNFRKKVKENYK